MEYIAIQLSGDLEKGGFKTEQDAWDWIYECQCESCKETGHNACAAEWDVETREQLDKWEKE
jgi:hypothetical protein